MRQIHTSGPRQASIRLPDDPITADLRSFAFEIGLSGACAMTKDELVEGLRQFHMLRHAIETATGGLKPDPAAEAQ